MKTTLDSTGLTLNILLFLITLYPVGVLGQNPDWFRQFGTSSNQKKNEMIGKKCRITARAGSS
jgi:hypothetical protein